MEKRNLQPDQELERTSGLLYFLMIISTGVSYTITQNLTTGDLAAEIAKLQASHKSYQFAILGSAAGYVAFLLLGPGLRQERGVEHAGLAYQLGYR